MGREPREGDLPAVESEGGFRLSPKRDPRALPDNSMQLDNVATPTVNTFNIFYYLLSPFYGHYLGHTTLAQSCGKTKQKTFLLYYLLAVKKILSLDAKPFHWLPLYANKPSNLYEDSNVTSLRKKKL